MQIFPHAKPCLDTTSDSPKGILILDLIFWSLVKEKLSFLIKTKSFVDLV